MATPKDNKKSKAKRKPKAKPVAPTSGSVAGTSPAQVGVTSGVGVSETWIRVFEQNEQAAEQDRLTDKQISESMKSEFPALAAITFDRVEIARGKYNRGGFHKKDKSGKVMRPRVRSTRHGGGDDASAGGRRNARSSDGVPMRDRVVSQKRDFKSHKK